MPTAKQKKELDLGAFPPGSVTEYSTLVCLACTFDIFTAVGKSLSQEGRLAPLSLIDLTESHKTQFAAAETTAFHS